MARVLLAEFEVWHSRPMTPTRRVALGHLALPVEPPPGFGGLLLAGVVAFFLEALDEDFHPDLVRLINQIDRGERVVQPRLRHRFQVDRHGLARTTHRLVGNGESIEFDIADTAVPVAQILGAVYAAERFAPHARRGVCEVLHRAVRWNGPVGPAFLSQLTGASAVQASSMRAFVDPIAWALDVLGFEPGTAMPSKKDVMARFRSRLREVHPDHGGSADGASQAIIELGEARRVLTEVRP